MFNSFYFIKFNISFSFYNIPSWGFPLIFLMLIALCIVILTLSYSFKRQKQKDNHEETIQAIKTTKNMTNHSNIQISNTKNGKAFDYSYTNSKKKPLNHQILKSISTITEMLSLDMNISHSMVKLILFFTKIE